jgi:hypothetical protein
MERLEAELKAALANAPEDSAAAARRILNSL